MDSSRRDIAKYAIAFLVVSVGIAAAAHLTGTVPVDNGVSLQAPDGMNATLTGATDAHLEEPFPTSGTVEWTTEAGNVSFFSSGAAAATIDKSDIEGTWTNVTAIDADPNTVQIDPGDKDAVVVGKQITAISFRQSYSLDDGTVDFEYTSIGGVGRVTIQGVPANTRIAAYNSSGTIVDEATSDGSGQLTLNSLDDGTNDVKLRAFSPSAPTHSNASPTGDISNPPDQVSVDVSDADFPNGDSVTVTIDLDGSQIHTETISSNQTVTASVPASGKTGGTHTWQVTSSDDYGESTTDSYSYNVPTNLTLREEQPPHSKLDSATVTATFYEDVENDPLIINRTTSDGTINLTGLPVSSEFSVQIQAPGYHNRTVILEDIYTQSDVFLINKTNTSTIENRFVVSDRTGNFPPDDTEIRIQAAINESIYNGSGGFSWMTVSGDDLGADEAYVDDLIEEKRYRLVVSNEQGDQRILGAYTPETSGTVDLTIGSVVIDPDAGESVGVNATWYNATGQQPKVRVEYNDSTQNTSKLHLEIYEYKNKSNKLLSNTTYSAGPYGTFSTTETVPKGENDTQWVVHLVAERPSGNVVIRQPVGPGSPVLTDMPAYLVTLLFVGTIWMVAGLFSQLNGDFGALIVAGLGGIFFYLGLVPAYLGAGVVGLSFLAAAILFIRERGAGGL